MTFELLNRRVHLYLGMFLLPWVVMYALSSLVFSHLSEIRAREGRTNPAWTVEMEKSYSLPVAKDADPRIVGARILEDLGMPGPFFATRPTPSRLNIKPVNFWKRQRVTYDMDQQRVVVEGRTTRWWEIWTGLHLRSGYRQNHFLSDVWAVALDLVCIGFLLWIASGLYMWWPLRRSRLSGALTLLGGFVAFLFFLVAL